MKIKQLKDFIVNGWTPLLIGFPLALSAFAASDVGNVWIAKPTGVRSCEVAKGVQPNLEEAVSDLEAKNILVHRSLVGRITGQVQCFGCGCPDGTFNVAEVESGPALNEVIESTDWSLIRAEDVRVEE